MCTNVSIPIIQAGPIVTYIKLIIHSHYFHKNSTSTTDTDRRHKMMNENFVRSGRIVRTLLYINTRRRFVLSSVWMTLIYSESFPTSWQAKWKGPKRRATPHPDPPGLFDYPHILHTFRRKGEPHLQDTLSAY